MKVARIDALFQPTVKMLVGLSYLIGLVYGAYLVFQSKVTLGELVSFNVYLGMMIWPMFAIGELINVMQRGNASLDRVNETLAYEPDVKDPKHPKLVQEPDYIQFDDVTFSYPSSTETNLKGFVYIKTRGNAWCCWKTGSGKTTLVRQLLRQYPLGDGDIAVSDVTLDQMTNENVLGWIGYVPQEHILFSKQRGKIFYSEIGKRLKRNSRKRLKLQRLKDLEFYQKG